MLYSNSNLWEIDRFLKSGGVNDTWGINSKHKNLFQPGDMAVIRVTSDGRSNKHLSEQSLTRLEPGIYAVVLVEDYPYCGMPIDKRFFLNPKKLKKGWHVKIRYLTSYIDNPITVAKMKKNKKLSKNPCHIISPIQGRSVLLTKEVFDNIIKISNSKKKIQSNTNNASTRKEIIDIENRQLHVVPGVKYRLSKVIERGASAKLLKKRNNFECQICKALDPHNKTQSFIKKNVNEQYIEIHHVSPISKRQIGTNHFKNLITICPLHHRQIHFGKVSEPPKSKGGMFEFIIDGKKIKVKKNG